MKLFELDDQYRVTFEPELFTIQAFADLRDSRKKDTALLLKELSFIYFFCDLKSDFQFQTDPKTRVEEIKKYVALDEKWKADDKIKKCMEIYNYLSQTPSSRLLESSYIAIEKLKSHLAEIDLNERNPKTNAPIWNPKVIADIAKTIPDLVKSTREAEAEFIKDQQENDKLKANKVKALYEDGFIRKEL